MKTLTLLVISSLLSGLSLNAQEEINLYEKQSFQPPENAMIREFENSLAPMIEAKSLNDQNLIIPNLEKVQLLWFYDEHFENDYLLELMLALNAIEDIESIVFVNLTTQEFQDQSTFKTNELTVIPNSRVLSEAIFGHDLGYPRIFLIGTSGRIEKVFTPQMITELDQPFIIISSLCNSIK